MLDEVLTWNDVVKRVKFAVPELTVGVFATPAPALLYVLYIKGV